MSWVYLVPAGSGDSDELLAHQLAYAAELGLGSLAYELIEVCARG